MTRTLGQRTRCTRCESRSADRRSGAADTPASRHARPTAGRPRSDRGWIAPDRCVGRIRCRCSAALLGVRRESAGDRSRPRSSSRLEIPTTRESTYNRAAIPPVLPCWLHIKREHHPILDGHVGSLLVIEAAEQTATPAAVRAGGRVLPHQIDKSKKLTYRDDRSLDNAPNTSGVVSRWNR